MTPAVDQVMPAGQISIPLHSQKLRASSRFCLRGLPDMCAPTRLVAPLSSPTPPYGPVFHCLRLTLRRIAAMWNLCMNPRGSEGLTSSTHRQYVSNSLPSLYGTMYWTCWLHYDQNAGGWLLTDLRVQVSARAMGSSSVDGDTTHCHIS